MIFRTICPGVDFPYPILNRKVFLKANKKWKEGESVLTPDPPAMARTGPEPTASNSFLTEKNRFVRMRG
jgi:hypothetical protein